MSKAKSRNLWKILYILLVEKYNINFDDNQKLYETIDVLLKKCMYENKEAEDCVDEYVQNKSLKNKEILTLEVEDKPVISIEKNIEKQVEEKDFLLQSKDIEKKKVKKGIKNNG